MVLFQFSSRAARWLPQWVARHPRQTTAAIAAALTLGTGGAFAVASLSPDIEDVPVRNVFEEVTPLPLDWQAEALEQHNLALYHSEVIRSSDSFASLFRRLNIDDAKVMAYLRGDSHARQAFRTGRTVTAEVGSDRKAKKIAVRWINDDGAVQRLVIEQNAAGVVARNDFPKLTTGIRLASGAIRTSLYAATDAANMPDSVAKQMTGILDSTVDFHRGLRRGDRFAVVYEVQELDGEVVHTGRILSVEFTNSGKTHQAVWFQEAGTKGAYYSPDGATLRRPYLTSPLEYSRVTSGFDMRVHPISRQWKAHLGVDYGAPTGTPVRTVGDGVVEFAGWQNGFGNVIIVQHRNQHSTVYGHLSRIGVRKGQTVEQGQFIGNVGTTGYSTGPHLHFEFRVAGVHHDPLSIARQMEVVPVSRHARASFNQFASNMRAELAAAQQLRATSAE